MKPFVVILALAVSAYAGSDVSLDTIAGMPATVDSGQTMVPGPVLSTSTGGGPGDVYFVVYQHGIPIYRDSSEFPALNPHVTCTLQLAGWAPSARESLQAVAWLSCSGDTYPPNDTCWQRFFVRVKDVAVTNIIVPTPDTVIDSGVVFYPRCRVWNFGNVSLSFDVRFQIGVYHSTENASLIPGGARVVTAPDAYVAMPGVWACQVSAIAVGDMHPGNNTLSDTFTVRGTILHDVGAASITAPGLWVDTLAGFTPAGQVMNNVSDSAVFWSFFTVFDAGGSPVYAESVQCALGPGETTAVAYGPVRITTVGRYVAAESVYLAGDQNSTNDVYRRQFYVVDESMLGDIGVVSILSPGGQVSPDSSFIPTAVWKNYSDHAMTYDAYFFLLNKYGVNVYSQMLAGNVLDAGEEETLGFAGFNVGNDTGMWNARCTTAAVGDTNPLNDTLGLAFLVAYPPGVEEAPNAELLMLKGATVVRGTIRLPAFAASVRCALFTPDGRRALVLKPGANDVTSVATGVYFVRAENPAACRWLIPVRKVVIQH